MSAAEAALALQGVTFGYDRTRVLDEVQLEIPVGDFACIIGPNAGGKSTLLKLMTGLLTPDRGSVRVLGATPQEARHRIGYLPQHTRVDPSFPITVGEVVGLGRLGQTRGRSSAQADREIVDAALADVSMGEHKRRPFLKLSGGQRQRVLIARALACEPDILMLDEPTANLDFAVEEQLYALLSKLNERLTIVLVSHDLTFVSTHVKTAVCVNRHVHKHSSKELSSEIIQELYGRAVRQVHHEHDCCTHEAAVERAERDANGVDA